MHDQGEAYLPAIAYPSGLVDLYSQMEWWENRSSTCLKRIGMRTFHLVTILGSLQNFVYDSRVTALSYRLFVASVCQFHAITESST